MRRRGIIKILVLLNVCPAIIYTLFLSKAGSCLTSPSLPCHKLILERQIRNLVGKAPHSWWISAFQLNVHFTDVNIIHRLAIPCVGVEYFRLLHAGTAAPVGHSSSSSLSEKPWFPLTLTEIFKQSQKLILLSYESWSTFSYYFQLRSTSSAFVAAKLLGWNSKELRFNVYDHIQWANQCASEYCPGEFLLFPLFFFLNQFLLLLPYWWHRLSEALITTYQY